jgi:hypothetical protein
MTDLLLVDAVEKEIDKLPVLKEPCGRMPIFINASSG